ncbi:hypothetical protein ACIXN4_22170 [Bacteroides fragilis]
MKNIAIYGAGGYGQEVACLIKAINAIECQWNLIGFLMIPSLLDVRLHMVRY